MLHDDKFYGELFAKEIFFEDVYKLRHLYNREIKTILDIGANCGFFSVYARVLFPNAKVVAVEPDAKAFSLLEKNTHYLNIDRFNVGLGDGTPIKLVQGDRPGSGSSIAKPGGDIPTLSLKAMLRKWKIDPNQNIIIKIDCEGAERFLVNEESEDILHRSVQWAMEIHYNEKHFPENYRFDFWNQWLDKMLSNSTKYGNASHYLHRRLIEKYGLGMVVKHNRFG